jgi:hypothetical protein
MRPQNLLEGKPPAGQVPVISQEMTSPTAAGATPKAGPRCSRCRGTKFRDVVLVHPPHNGRSTRRDCLTCGAFHSFPVWHGKKSEAAS